MVERSGSDRRVREREPWHLSKEVPIALILTLVGYGLTGIIFSTKLVSRVEALEIANAKGEETARRDAAKFDDKLNEIQRSVTKINDLFLEQARAELAREMARRR